MTLSAESDDLNEEQPLLVHLPRSTLDLIMKDRRCNNIQTIKGALTVILRPSKNKQSKERKQRKERKRIEGSTDEERERLEAVKQGSRQRYRAR
jgi:hypothetical protein